MQFNYENILRKLMTPEIVSALGVVKQRQGEQRLLSGTRPETLSRLCDRAKIQSTGASNRIENISTTDKRLRELVRDEAQPRTRDEREIAGYHYVLDIIHTQHDDIPITPNVILQLHRDLFRYTGISFAGKFKDSDNVIAERSETGELVARFRPTSAAATPFAIERICEEYRRQIARATFDPLLTSLVFAFDFVSIHPFNDGNGRMSRLITLLLMYRNGYTVGKYVSVESEIEATKETYYEVLAASSVGWSEGKNDYGPFVVYMLGVISACYEKLSAHLETLLRAETGEDSLRRYFNSLPGSASKREILEDNPTVSQRTTERILQKLQAEGFIEKVGAARATRYRKVKQREDEASTEGRAGGRG